MAGAAVVAANHNPGYIAGLPGAPQLDLAVGPQFERFDGLESPPLDNPAGRQRTDYFPTGPRPGQACGTPDVYTPGPISGVVGTLDGQPYPVSDRLHRAQGGYTAAKAPTVQWRLGVGQYGPSALGAQQTVVQSEITSNPPVPGDLASIIAGLA